MCEDVSEHGIYLSGLAVLECVLDKDVSHGHVVLDDVYLCDDRPDLAEDDELLAEGRGLEGEVYAEGAVELVVGEEGGVRVADELDDGGGPVGDEVRGEGGDDEVEVDGVLRDVAVVAERFVEDGRVGLVGDAVEEPLDGGREEAGVVRGGDPQACAYALEALRAERALVLEGVVEAAEVVLLVVREECVGAAREVAVGVGLDEGVCDAADLPGEALDDGCEARCGLEEGVAADHGELDVDAGHELADGGDLVEPVAACLDGLLYDAFGDVLVRQRLVGLGVQHRAPLLDALVHKVPECVQDLRDHHKLARVELGHARVAQKLHSLNHNLQRLHTVLRVPRTHHLCVHALYVLGVLLLRHRELLLPVAPVAACAALQLLEAGLLLVLGALLHAGREGVVDEAHCDLNALVGGELVQNLRLHRRPREEVVLALVVRVLLLPLLLLHRLHKGAHRGRRHTQVPCAQRVVAHSSQGVHFIAAIISITIATLLRSCGRWGNACEKRVFDHKFVVIVLCGTLWSKKICCCGC